MILNLLFYLTFLLFSLGQFARISFFGQQINFYLYEIFVFLTLLVLLTKYGLEPIKNSFKNFLPVYLFFLSLLFSFLLGIGKFKAFENLVGFLYLLRLFIYFEYFFYLIYYLKKYGQFKKTVRDSFLLFIILTSIFSFLQYVFYPDLRNLLYAGWDPHLYRIFGTFLDTSTAGAIYGLIFLTLFIRSKELVQKNWLRNLLLAAYLLFIVLTYSRSLYLVFLIMIILHAVINRWYKQSLFFILMFILLIFLVPKPFGEGVNLKRIVSIQSRVIDYQNALKIWSKNPLFGIGYNRIRYVKQQLNINEGVGLDITHSGASFHSSFLVILVSAGIIGLSLFILISIKLFAVSKFSKYAVIFLSLLSLSDNVILHPFILFLLFTLVSSTLPTPSHKPR